MSFLKDIVKQLDNEYAGLADDGVVGDTNNFIDTGSYTLNALLSGSIFGGLFSTSKAMAAPPKEAMAARPKAMAAPP